VETDATATIVDVGANVTLALVKNARNKNPYLSKLLKSILSMKCIAIFTVFI